MENFEKEEEMDDTNKNYKFIIILLYNVFKILFIGHKNLASIY
jgi:hypothetical protein